jgi:thymidylate synthase ThyX
MLFELNISSSCFAQLKRHRMATIIVQPYSTTLGISIPESVIKAKAVGLMRKAAGDSEKLYRKLKSRAGDAAEYALTNAHKRRVLIGINLRELYHFSRLRSDVHAQWEIRHISDMMSELAEEEMPAGTTLLGGKDSFHARKGRL